MASDFHAVVSFNVGGQLFMTLKETLLKEANSRLALISRSLLATARDPVTGAYVLDRDPKYFQLVLNWLRDGWCLLPKTAEERRELLQEVRYYQLSGFEGWLRTQELLADAGAYSSQEFLAMESPRPRMLQHLAQPPQMAPQQAYSPYGYQAYASPPSGPPAPPSPRSAAGNAGMMATGRGPPTAWMTGGPATATQTLPPQHLYHSATLGSGSPARSSPATANGGGVGLTAGWGGGGGWAGGGAGGAIASLREAFVAATGPQRPAHHVAAYSLASTADESSSWTSKYLRGNEGLRELVNTLLELSFLAPHRALNNGKSHVSITVACGHGQEASLVGNKDDYMRSKLLELRVRGALGWTFDLTLRPSSDVALWDKYGGVAAAVQDNWFVLGAILKDQFGVVLEEDSAARPTCVACRRTCLSVALNKIY